MLLDAARRSGREEEVARRRRGMGYEEGELELEEGEAAYGGGGGGYGYGGGELVDPDALTYIVRGPLRFPFFPSCVLIGWLMSWWYVVSCLFLFYFCLAVVA